MAVKERKGFMKWYFSPQGKKVVGCVYSLGAAVVIVGALFKILHWPGASVMLMMGMFTEAILFSIGVLDDPHPDLHWNHVFPQLTAKEEDPLVNHLNGQGGKTTEVFKEEDVKKLSNGIKSITQTTEKLTEFSNVLTSSAEGLKQNMDKATSETGRYVESQSLLNNSSEKLSTAYNGISDDVEKVVAQTKNYLSNVEVVNKNLETINSVYELQLSELRAQNDVLVLQNNGLKTIATTVENISGGVSKMQGLLESTLVEEQNFNKGVQELNTKVANLNSIYGNMLNALS